LTVWNPLANLKGFLRPAVPGLRFWDLPSCVGG